MTSFNKQLSLNFVTYIQYVSGQSSANLADLIALAKPVNYPLDHRGSKMWDDPRNPHTKPNSPIPITHSQRIADITCCPPPPSAVNIRPGHHNLWLSCCNITLVFLGRQQPTICHNRAGTALSAISRSATESGRRQRDTRDPIGNINSGLVFRVN